MNEAEYKAFLDSKHIHIEPRGFDYPPDALPSALFDWQRRAVVWALRTGCAALFEDCGMGKTLQQLAWAEAVAKHTGRPVIVLTPLAVAEQTRREAEKFGIRVPVRVVRDAACVAEGINICNYEKLHLLDASVFGGVVLDESSILKSYMGKTKRALVDAFASCPYRLACTATPAPNDHLELGNHAEFLGVMQSYEMIARWFDNDSMTAGGYTLKPHAAKDFWRWVASWAVCIDRPSAIGGCDDGFTLPELRQHNHTVSLPLAVEEGSEALFSDADMSATTMHKEKRRSAALRAEKAAEIANATDEQVIVWCDTNYEADELMKRIPDAIEVRGSMDDDERETNLAAFTTGKARVIVTKPEIAGFGLNWQHSHIAVFVGLSFSYERFYQAVRRQYRFGQCKTVDAHIITSDAEAACGRIVNAKQIQHEAMKSNMAEAMKEIQMENFGGSKSLRKTHDPIKHDGDGWTLFHGDCVDVTKAMDDNSVGLTVYSPPFSNLYTYSDSMADMGNSEDDAEFIEHYKYLIRDLYRVTIPGRLSVVHCKDMPMYKGRDGSAGLRDFPGMIIRAHEECGWTFHSRVTIWKDPVIEMQRTKNHGLLHKILCKDSCNSRQGMADYLIVFRKWVDGLDEFPSPVCGKSAEARFDKYVGTEGPHMTPNARQNSINIWQRYASPVWFDIRQTNVLGYRDARGEDDTKHICPLQLDVIERSVELWSNPGDLVYSPFNGIGSEGYVSLKCNRKYVGAELKREYVDVAVDNLKRACEERDSVGKDSLFAGIVEPKP
jgi:DNA modification methylase/superfamily II DNA or RNA helicase